MLREAGFDYEGFYLKVDGDEETGKEEQLYLHLQESQVVDVIEGWIREITNNGSDYGKWLLNDVLSQVETKKRT